MNLYGLIEERERGHLNIKEETMTKKTPRIIPVIPISPNRPIEQDTFDLNKAYDIIHLRNSFIRSRYNSLQDCNVPYNERIRHLSVKYHSSPQNIERIITDNTDK